MRYTHQEINTVIPNRYPLMFLDSLEVFENQAIGFIVLSDDTWFFSCHFPNYPIVPMSLIIESMTQVFSATFLSKVGTLEIPVISSIMGVDGKGIKQKESVVPGDRVRITASLISFKRGIAKGVCKAFKNDAVDSFIEFEIVDVLPSMLVRLT